MRNAFGRLLAAGLYLGSVYFAHAQTSTNAAPPAATTAAAAQPPAPVLDPSAVIAQAESKLTDLRSIQNESQDDPLATTINAKIAPFSGEVDEYSRESTRIFSANPSLDEVRHLQKNWTFLKGYPVGWKDDLAKRAGDIAKTLADLDKNQATWTQMADSAKAPGTAPEVATRISNVLTSIGTARKQVAARQAKLLALQDQVIHLDSQISDMLAAVGQARDRAVNELFVQNSSAVWNGATPVETTPTSTPAPAVDNSWRAQWATLQAYISFQTGRFLVHGIILGVLVIFFYWVRQRARHWAAAEPDAKAALAIFETPIAAGVLLSVVASAWLYPLAPRFLTGVLGAIALVPTAIILRRLIEPRLFPILNALVLFFFIEKFRSIAAMSPAVSRLFFLCEIVGGIGFLIWLLLSQRLTGSSTSTKRFGKAVRFSARAALFILVVGWFANVFGFVLLANLLCEAVQSSANLAMMLYAGTRILDALALLVLRIRPVADLGMVKLHASLLLRRTNRILAALACLVWILFTLEMFSLRAPFIELVHRLLATSLSFGVVQSGQPAPYSISARQVVLFAVVIWGSVYLSRFVRFIMECDVYPRLRLAHGIPYAISTMLHYAVLILAFIAATAILDINMMQFTILVSALGVGIGFGLQNIINNFVSGLILLFERPIKIGDSIQVGDSVGVVERIGIRASVLRTTTGAEMIVPNGSLISDRVTNWTFSNQQRIISMPLNVVRGPDINHLIELLTTTAAAHPKVRRDPSPQVLVLSLGANLALELRAWTDDVDDWTQVRSDLLRAISLALAKENIAIV